MIPILIAQFLPMLPALFGAATTTATTCAGSGFLGFVPWYQNLVDPTTCNINVNLTDPSSWNQIWVIGLNVFDDILRVAGLLAVVFVIVGGIKYMTSQGEPENTRKALGTIINSLIGLGIAVAATPAIGFISNQLGGDVTSNVYGIPNPTASQDTLKVVLNLAFEIIGAVAVLLIIIAGLKYVTSAGDPHKAARAKDTILYAVIGVVVVALAAVIVNFVLTSI